MISPGKGVWFFDCGLFMGGILIGVSKVVKINIFPEGKLNTFELTSIELFLFLDEFRSIVTNPLLHPIELQEFVAGCNEIA